jgi:hypothetical protein
VFLQRTFQSGRQNGFCNAGKQARLYASALEFHQSLEQDTNAPLEAL